MIDWRRWRGRFGNSRRLAGVPRAQLSVVRTFAHDPDAYTQGLCCHGDLLFESTGLMGRSSLREIDPRNGRVLRVVPIADDYAEGIAIHDGQIYQLSWHSGIARVYSFPDLIERRRLSYGGEGWGLASAPGGLVMSDGSDVLRWRDSGFAVQRELGVHINQRPVNALNDLTCGRGRLYVNVWRTPLILEVNPESGSVTRAIDGSALVSLVRPTHPEAVLNGITYRDSTDTFLVTGKLWPLMFEVTWPHASA